MGWCLSSFYWSNRKLDIRSFKNFLDSLLYSEDEELKRERRALLKDYLDSQKPKHEEHIFLRELEQAWSFANQVRNDHLFSSITAVLALLFRVISGLLDFRDYGFLLGRMILQFSQIKLVSRGLFAPPHKEFVISPCLRLLTEIVSFDAGALGRQVYVKRDFTFDTKIVARNLQLNKSNAGDAKGDPRKQTVRATTVRYLLAHLKYQDEGVKMDILRIGNIVRALFTYLEEDPPHIVREILSVVKNNVLLDESLPRQTKSQVMTDRTLADIAGLYRLDENHEGDGIPVHEIAREVLLLVCTKPDLGVLLTTAGWYFPGTERERATPLESSAKPAEDKENRPSQPQSTLGTTLADEEQRDSVIDLGLDSIEWYSNIQKEVPLRNVVLASFIQGLRPYSNNLERELLITIFGAAPELVADYFFKKRSFQFDPKLTATWIGYASVLFNTVQLPVPPLFGRRTTYHSVPPPLKVVLDSILPQPLSQHVLKKCLNSRNDMITFFTIRILTVAFEKLDHVLNMFRDAGQERGYLWNQAASRLVEGFYDRCPPVRDIITIFQQTPKSNPMCRDVATRLLALCFRVTPSMALDEKFDIATILAEALQSLNNDEAEPELRQMRLLELSHLVTIAGMSPDMKWFNKPRVLRFSPFITLLRLVVQNTSESSTDALKELLHSIIKEHGLFQADTSIPPLEILIHVLSKSKDQDDVEPVLDFLDDCIQRFTRRSLKYLDDLELLQQEIVPMEQTFRPLSMILVPILEQWTFVPRNRPSDVYSVGRMINAYLKLSVQIEEDENVISILLRKFVDTVNASELDISKLNSSHLEESFQLEDLTQHLDEKTGSEAVAERLLTKDDAASDGQSFAANDPPPEPKSHPELLRWVHKDSDAIIEEDLISGLVLCLCSTQLSIRKEALTNARKLAAKLATSAHIEKDQVHLLLLEAAETASSTIDTTPLPYVAGVFAARAASVLAEPTHFLYPKVNQYLNKGPAWTVERLPSYWIDKILLHPPTEDDARQREILWLLDYLFDALRTPRDLEIYRVRSVFERVLALYAAPFTTREIKGKILGLLARATGVEGGSTTLITRVGVVSWLDGRIAMRDGVVAELKSLRERTLEMCDRGRIAEWSAGMLADAQRVQA